MPDPTPWEDLKGTLEAVAKRGIPHHFAYHPGPSTGTPLLALNKLKAYTQGTAGAALTAFRDATLDEDEKKKPQPALSAYIWGQVSLVQSGQAWILRFKSEKRPPESLKKTFILRMRALNGQLKGAIPTDILKTAEIVYDEAETVAPTSGVDLTAITKKLAELRRGVSTTAGALASLNPDVLRLVERVGRLELELDPWPEESGAPDTLWTGVTDLAGKTTALPGLAGHALDLGQELDDLVEDAEAALAAVAGASDQGAAVKKLNAAVTALENALQKATEEAEDARREESTLRSAYQKLLVAITQARKEATSRVGEPEVALPEDWSELRGAWETAMEAVEGQIRALQRALRETDDDELHEIAEYGLNGITSGFRVPFNSALMEADRAPASSRGASIELLAERANAFADHLEKDPRVVAVENNPFNVQIDIVGTLAPVLLRFSALAA